jgi:hypothetical protein
MQVCSFELVTLFRVVTTVCLNGTKTCAKVISCCWSFYCECCASMLALWDNWVDISKHTWLVHSSLDVRNEFKRYITFKDILRKNCCIIIFNVWGFLVGIWGVVAFGRRWKQHFRSMCCFLCVGDAHSGLCARSWQLRPTCLGSWEQRTVNWDPLSSCNLSRFVIYKTSNFICWTQIERWVETLDGFWNAVTF